MFKTENDRQTFLNTLKAYIEEYSPEDIYVLLPEQFLTLVNKKQYEPIKVDGWELNAVGIRVLGFTTNYTQLL